MSNRPVVYTVTLNNASALQGMMALESGANRVDNVMSTLRDTMIGVTAAWGAMAAINIGKEWVQGAADYEVAMLRIRNASKNATEGATNIKFINDEVDKLKLTLQDSADAYGKFLVRVSNSGLAGEQVRKLHDEILSIAKVTGARPGQMDAAVLDIGKMLAEGVLEARTMRQLERVFPQITPFVAQQLHMTTQQLSRAESSGKLTKSAIDSKILLTAIDQYYDSIKSKIPGSLDTIQSGINEVDTAWTRFKNDIVFDNRKDLIELFTTLKEGIGWLRDNKQTVENIAAGVAKMVVGYVAYKAVLGGLSIIQNLFISSATKEVLSIEARTLATNQLVASMERLVYVQATANNMPTLAAMSAANAAAAGMATSSIANATIGGALGTIGGSIATFGKSVISSVFLVGMAAEVASMLGLFGKRQDGSDVGVTDLFGQSNWAHTAEGIYSTNSRTTIENPFIATHYLFSEEDQKIVTELNKAAEIFGGLDKIKFNVDGTINYDFNKNELANMMANVDGAIQSGILGFLGGSFTNYAGQQFPYALGKGPDADAGFNKGGNNGLGKRPAGTEHIRGNSVTNIHVEIHQLNGQNNCKFELKNTKDFNQRDFAAMVTRTLAGAVNDSQTISKHS